MKRVFSIKLYWLLIVGVLILSLGFFLLRRYHHSGVVRLIYTEIVDRSLIILKNKQRFDVEIPDEINADLVSIQWYSFPDLRSPHSIEIFNKHPVKRRIPYSKGGHGFSVYYGDSLMQSAGHFSISKHGYHNYVFDFSKTKDGVDFQFTVIGPDSSYRREWDAMYNWRKGSYYAAGNNIPFVPLAESSIRNSIDFTLPAHDLERLTKPKIDTVLKKLSCTIGDEEYPVKSIKNRGVTSLLFSRKSYNVKLNNNASFSDAEGVRKELKTFTLISLTMDHYYFRNSLAFGVLQELNLIEMFHTFAEVKMNGKSQGVYLLIEHPKTHMRDSLDASFIIRRRYEHSYFGEKMSVNPDEVDYDFSKSLLKEDLESFIDQYHSIYDLIENESGEALYKSLTEIMDLEKYLKILAFQYILCNHDYSDELYLYKSRQSDGGAFGLLPWDFDEILHISPHEGWKRRNDALGDRLIFSSENELDEAIALDPVLYKKYLGALHELINDLDRESIRKVFQNIYNELYPFYENPDIVGLSRYDDFKSVYTMSEFDTQINGTYTYLQERIRTISSQLDQQVSNSLSY